jgi:hypothetical protein
MEVMRHPWRKIHVCRLLVVFNLKTWKRWDCSCVDENKNGLTSLIIVTAKPKLSSLTTVLCTLQLLLTFHSFAHNLFHLTIFRIICFECSGIRDFTFSEIQNTCTEFNGNGWKSHTDTFEKSERIFFNGRRYCKYDSCVLKYFYSLPQQATLVFDLQVGWSTMVTTPTTQN